MITTTASSASGSRESPDGAASSELHAIGVLTHAARPRWQFRTSSLLWLTFTAAMALAYARLFGAWAILATLATPPLAAALGLAIGAGRSRALDSAYWAVIGATLGTICVVAAPQPQWWMALWPAVGASAGSVAGAGRLQVTFVKLLLAAAMSGLLWYLLQTPASPEYALDLAIVPAVAVSFMGLVEIVNWLRTKHRTSRDAWAAGLIFAVIAGNLWATLVAGRLGNG